MLHNAHTAAKQADQISTKRFIKFDHTEEKRNETTLDMSQSFDIQNLIESLVISFQNVYNSMKASKVNLKLIENRTSKTLYPTIAYERVCVWFLYGFMRLQCALIVNFLGMDSLLFSTGYFMLCLNGFLSFSLYYYMQNGLVLYGSSRTT